MSLQNVGSGHIAKSAHKLWAIPYVDVYSYMIQIIRLRIFFIKMDNS